MSAALKREVVIVHSSDLHLGSDNSIGSLRSSDRLSVLGEVLRTATAVNADLLILAGDTFDHNRQPSQLLEQTARTMGEFNAPIVILPGNHDPLTPDSVYRRTELAATLNVYVLGLTNDKTAVFPELELEVWGRAHLDYLDMAPLLQPSSRSMRWQLTAAHGHYVKGPEEPDRLLGSWLIRPGDLNATCADYVALGHWNRAASVGNQQINAYYSGSPDHAGTVNVIKLRQDSAVEVTFASLDRREF